jgi:cytochrome c5
MSDEHQAFIKTPRQLITVVVLAFLVPIAVILLLAFFVDVSPRWGAGADTMAPEAVEARIRPVAGFELVDASIPREARSGEQVYNSVCATCHATGVAGAPKIGDKEAWGARIKSGLEALVASALHGKGAMPPQGGGEFNDQEIANAVVHMANAAGADFEPPKAAEAQTASAGAAPASGGGAGKTAAPAASAASSAAGTAATASTPPAANAPSATAAPVASSGGAAGGPSAGVPAETAAAPAAAGDGKKVYDTTCALCHTPGLAGAPKFGDKAAWAPRIEQGIDHLVELAIKGIRAMPPRGGNPKLSDAEMHAAVEYMVAAAK